MCNVRNPISGKFDNYQERKKRSDERPAHRSTGRVGVSNIVFDYI